MTEACATALAPFSTPWLLVLDTIRLFLVVGTITVACWVLAISHRLPGSRPLACYAFAAYSTFSALFEFARLGQPHVSPVLALILVGMAFGLMFCVKISRAIKTGEEHR